MNALLCEWSLCSVMDVTNIMGNALMMLYVRHEDVQGLLIHMKHVPGIKLTVAH